MLWNLSPPPMEFRGKWKQKMEERKAKVKPCWNWSQSITTVNRPAKPECEGSPDRLQPPGRLLSWRTSLHDIAGPSRRPEELRQPTTAIPGQSCCSSSSASKHLPAELIKMQIDSQARSSARVNRCCSHDWSC